MERLKLPSLEEVVDDKRLFETPSNRTVIRTPAIAAPEGSVTIPVR
jgi:hypothetical protein